MKRFVFTASAALIHSKLPARAASESAIAVGSSDGLLGSLLTASLLLACAWTALYVWRRKRQITLSGGSDALVHVLSVTSLGMRERVAVLRVRERTLVVGVTAAQITLLAELGGGDMHRSQPPGAVQSSPPSGGSPLG
jgi:flagellar biogenesis protein FliO